MTKGNFIKFQEEESVTPLPFGDRPAGRILLTILSITLFGLLLFGLSLLMIRFSTPPPPQNHIVVASHNLHPYQRIRTGDVSLGQVNTAVEGTVLTDIAPLVGQAITLRAIDESEAVTTESVVMFPATVTLTDTVILAIPLPTENKRATVPALEPGLSVLLIGTIISNTLPPSTYSITVPLIAITDMEAVVAVLPEIATQLGPYLSPWGQVILAPATNRSDAR